MDLDLVTQRLLTMDHADKTVGYSSITVPIQPLRAFVPTASSTIQLRAGKDLSHQKFIIHLLVHQKTPFQTHSTLDIRTSKESV